MGRPVGSRPVAAYDRGVSVGVSTDERPAADPDEPADPDAAEPVPDSVRRRLTPVPGGTWQTWVAAAWVVVIAAILRFVNLGLPNSLVFDEVYYANEGQQLLDHGVEWRTETDAAGNVTASFGDYVVHPPLGKWIIAARHQAVRQRLGRYPRARPGLRLAVQRRRSAASSRSS